MPAASQGAVRGRRKPHNGGPQIGVTTRSRQLPGLLIGFSLLAVLAGCSPPGVNLRKEGAAQGFLPMELPGGDYRLLSFFKPGRPDGDVLHVYFEGDGLPWLSRTRVAADPTPRNPLMLRLMALDPAPALYLGRPCYNGHANDPGCTPLLWTHQRYSPLVVDSMEKALESFLRNHRFRKVRFFGHSGGGALALLVAERTPGTESVVTIGGNLDIARWANYHGYSALAGSLNPSASKINTAAERHYYGAKDEQTPPDLFRDAIRRRPNARLILVPKFDHLCCWETIWAQILE